MRSPAIGTTATSTGAIPRFWRMCWLIAAKDLRIERHSRVVTNQILPFAGVTMVMFAFAIDSNDVLERVAPGLIWLATLFSLLVLVQRAFAIETDDGALDALRVAGVDPTAIFFGKVLALAVQLAVLEVILLVVALVLYGPRCRRTGWCCWSRRWWPRPSDWPPSVRCTEALPLGSRAARHCSRCSCSRWWRPS